jgi:hypothetical protein
MCQHQLIRKKLEEIPQLKDKAQKVRDYFLETANLSPSLPARQNGERLRLLAEKFNDFRDELRQQNLLDSEEFKSLQNRDIYFKIIGPGLMDFSRLVTIVAQNKEIIAQAGTIVAAVLAQNNGPETKIESAEIITAIKDFRESLDEIKALPKNYLLAPEEIYQKIILPARETIAR